MIYLAAHVLIQLAVIVRLLIRPHREPASCIAWVVVIAVVPMIGIIAYLFLGEVNIGRRRVSRLQEVLEQMPDPSADLPGVEPDQKADVPQRYTHLFRLGRSISGFEPIGGNTAYLLADSNATIDAMVADIDAANDHVHVLFFIWLTDTNGSKSRVHFMHR